MSNERIIIAEDNCVMLDVMRYILSGAGFEVLAAEGGREALSLLEEVRHLGAASLSEDS